MGKRRPRDQGAEQTCVAEGREAGSSFNITRTWSESESNAEKGGRPVTMRCSVWLVFSGIFPKSNEPFSSYCEKISEVGTECFHST